MIGIIEHEGGRLIDGHIAGAGDGVRAVSGVDRSGLESREVNLGEVANWLAEDRFLAASSAIVSTGQRFAGTQ